jgi:putative copper resistance protein D
LAGLVVVLARFFDYSGAMILFGSSLFLLYSPIGRSEPTITLLWTKRLLFCAAVVTLLATVVGFFAQTAGLAGSFMAALQPAAFKSALLEMHFGLSSLIRGAVAVVAAVSICVMRAGRALWWICAFGGSVVCASFAWMGHGAATDGVAGWLHLAGDIAHSLAAAGWIGALAMFFVLLRGPLPSQQQWALAQSLGQFSGIGTVLVALLILSGVINSVFLVGWNISHIATTPYGQVLAAKLFLFALMLALAAVNRYQHSPALARALANSADAGKALGTMRRSVIAETGAATGVLALVSWLGTLAPVTAP